MHVYVSFRFIGLHIHLCARDRVSGSFQRSMRLIEGPAIYVIIRSLTSDVCTLRTNTKVGSFIDILCATYKYLLVS